MSNIKCQDTSLKSLFLFTLLAFGLQYIVDRALDAFDTLLRRTFTPFYNLFLSIASHLSLISTDTPPPPTIHVLLWTISGCAGVGLGYLLFHAVQHLCEYIHPPLDLDLYTDRPPLSQSQHRYGPIPLDYWTPLPLPTPQPPNHHWRGSRSIEKRERNRWLVEFDWLTSHREILLQTHFTAYSIAVTRLRERAQRSQDLFQWDLFACPTDWRDYPDVLTLVHNEKDYGWAIDAIETNRRRKEALEASRRKSRLREFPPVHVEHPRRKLDQPLQDEERLPLHETNPTSALVNVTSSDIASSESTQQRSTSPIAGSADPAISHYYFSPILSSPSHLRLFEPVATSEPIADGTSPTSSQQINTIEVENQEESHGATVPSASPLITPPPTSPVEVEPPIDETPSTTTSEYEVKFPLPGLWASMHSPANRNRRPPNSPSTPTPQSNSVAESEESSSGVSTPTSHDDGPSTPESLQPSSLDVFPPAHPCHCPINHTHRACGPLPCAIPVSLLWSPSTFTDDSDFEDDGVTSCIDVASKAGYTSDAEFDVATADHLCNALGIISIDEAPSRDLLESVSSTLTQHYTVPLTTQNLDDLLFQTTVTSEHLVLVSEPSPTPAFDFGVASFLQNETTAFILLPSETVSVDVKIEAQNEPGSESILATPIPCYIATAVPSSLEMMDPAGDDDDDDLEEVTCDGPSVHRLGDADMGSESDGEGSVMEEEAGAQEETFVSEVPQDAGMDGEEDADGIDDDGRWEEGFAVALETERSMDVMFNFDINVPMEGAMPSTTLLSDSVEVEQPRPSTPMMAQMSVGEQDEAGNFGFQAFKNTMDVSLFGAHNDNPISIGPFADTGTISPQGLPATTLMVEGDSIGPLAVPILAQDELAAMVTFMESVMAIPASELTFDPAQLLGMTTPSALELAPTGYVDFSTGVPPHDIMKPPTSTFAPLPFDLSFLAHSPTAAAENPMHTMDEAVQWLDAPMANPFVFAQLVAASPLALELATEATPLEEFLVPPNTLAFLEENKLASWDYEFEIGLEYDGGGVWASEDGDSETMVPAGDAPPTEEEEELPSETEMLCPFDASSPHEVAVDQRPVRGLPRRARRSALRVGFGAPLQPPVQPEPSTIDQLSPATASAEPEFVSEATRVIKRIPRRLISSVYSPSAPLVQRPFAINSGAATPTTMPGPSSFTFTSFAPSASGALALDESALRIFKAMPQTEIRVPTASLTQCANEFGMTKAELREYSSQTDSLEAQSRDEDRVPKSDYESEDNDDDDEYIIYEED